MFICYYSQNKFKKKYKCIVQNHDEAINKLNMHLSSLKNKVIARHKIKLIIKNDKITIGNK